MSERPSAAEPSAAARAWAGRTVVVTGASQGIGAATAALFALDGADVIVHGRDAERTADVVARIASAGGSAAPVLADLRDPDAAQAVVEHARGWTGRVDVLVNNAGANTFRGVLDTTLQDWEDCLALDLRAVWLCSRAAASAMPVGSAIVNVSSNHAGSTLPGVFPYNVAKAGVLALTQSLAIELAEQGIRVNAVAPGYVDTPINDAYFAGFADPALARRSAERLHPLGRLGAPEEVARAVRFLASDVDSGFTTGTTLTVDGGRSALLQDPPPDDDILRTGAQR